MCGSVQQAIGPSSQSTMQTAGLQADRVSTNSTSAGALAPQRVSSEISTGALSISSHTLEVHAAPTKLIVADTLLLRSHIGDILDRQKLMGKSVCLGVFFLLYAHLRYDAQLER